jgi:histidinol-phosphatase (PHP family)
MHTKYCGHAVGEMEEYVEAAVGKGLTRIIFLGHLEAGIRYPRKNWLSPPEFEAYFQRGRELKEEFRDAITIYIGIELGYNPDEEKQLLAMRDRYPWDAVALSYHYIKAESFHINICSAQPGNRDRLLRLDSTWAVRHYYGTLLRGIEAVKPDFLCHFDMIAKYLPVDSYEVAWDIIGDIMDAMTAGHTGIEINTAGFRHRDEPYPCAPILKEMVHRGIPVLAGSDSHAPAQIGRFFDRVETLYRRIGNDLQSERPVDP